MLNACCVSTDLGMYGCMEKLMTKDGFCIYLKNVLKIASISVGGHIYLTVNASIFIIVLRVHTLQCERYLGCMQSRIYKTALARFRFGVSRINCYRLRFSAAFNLRNGPFCTTSTEDDCHMLFQCPAYTDLRTKSSFETTARTGSQKEQYVQILCSANVNTLLNLSKFILFAIKRRENLITT